MRTMLMVAMLVAVAAPGSAQERLADQLRKGIVEEETSQNLDKAIQAYQAIVARYDEDRKVAGSALFRLAECYRKVGKREQAITAYQRVVREFADQAAMVETSHRQLAALGAADVREVGPARAAAEGTRARAERPREVVPEPASREVAPERTRAAIETRTESLAETKIEMARVVQQLDRAQDLLKKGLISPSEVQDTEARLRLLQERARQQEAEIFLNLQMAASVQKEISLVEQRIAAIEANVQVGKVSPQDAELLQLRRDLLGLQRKLAEFQAGAKRQR